MQALAITWTAGRNELLLALALQVVAGVSLVGVLLIGRSALNALLGTVDQGGSFAAVLPWVLVVASVAAAGSLVSAVRRERQLILGELSPGTLLAGRTVLLISHRFSSVRSADRIYVLDGGLVVESGDHDELMALDGLYAELFTLQAAAYRDQQPVGDPLA